MQSFESQKNFYLFQILELVQRICTKLACSGRQFNANTALFLTNKIDDYDAKKAEEEVLEKLQTVLPMVTREHIVSTTAKRVHTKDWCSYNNTIKLDDITHVLSFYYILKYI